MTEDKNKNATPPQEESREEPMEPRVEVETDVQETADVHGQEAASNSEEAEADAEVIDFAQVLNTTRRLQEENKRLKNEMDALKDRLQRQTAEYDNFRRRTQKEKEGIYSDSVVEVVKEILPVLDNLEKSLQLEGGTLEDHKKGVEMTLSQFKDAMKKLKVAEIDTDSGFDPNFHEAVMHVTDPAYGEKEVAEVFLKGYQRDEKIIRYSVVKVVN